MDTRTALNRLSIATPCTMDWNAMPGDDRARFCERCQKHVFNLSALSSEEAVALIRERHGVLCGLLYRRPDGTVVTADCSRVEERAPARGPARALVAIWTAFAAAVGLVVWAPNSLTSSGECEPLMGVFVPPHEILQDPDDSNEAGTKET